MHFKSTNSTDIKSAPTVYSVKGELDQLDTPLSRIVQVEGLKIGLLHGHSIIPWGDPDALAMTARQLVTYFLWNH